MCKKHKTCQTIYNNGKPTGVGVLFLVNYHNGSNTRWVVGLGKETGGSYKGSYNLCAGKMDQDDHGCYMKACIRELKEEFKVELELGEGNSFDEHFRRMKTDTDGRKKPIGKMRFFTFHKTPIFVGVFNGTKRSDIREKMWNDNNNNNLAPKYQEMDNFDFFELQSHHQIEGYHKDISSFASGVMNLA